MKSILLAIDAGSSSVRCTAYEYRGVVDARNNHEEGDHPSLVTPLDSVCHSIPLAAVVPSTGHIKIHEVLAAIDECVDEVLRLLRENVSEEYQLVGVGFSSFVMNLVGVDARGDPVGEIATLSYACNREDVVRECQVLRDTLGPERVQALYQRTGAPIHPSYALPQLLAFYSNEENRHLFGKIDKWISISSICHYRWCGKPHIQMPMSYSEASWTGMLNFRKCGWDDDVVDALERCEDAIKSVDDYTPDEVDDYIDILPPGVDYDANLPFLVEGIPQRCDDGSDNAYWERWPEFRSKSISLFLGVGDGAAANIGSKCGPAEQGSRRLAVTIGTSAAARVCLPLQMESQVFPPPDSQRDVSVPPGLFCYRVDRGHVLLGGALTDGGSVVEWARSLLNLQSTESFEACLEQVKKVYEGHCTSTALPTRVTMIPFLSGERSTGFRGGAQGCVSGITRATTAVDIVHACLESVILRIGCVLKLLNEACRSEQVDESRSCRGTIVASGNALERNSLWRQMLADCSSMDVVVDDESREGSSRGVAILMAGSLRQRELGNPLITHIAEELLVVRHETKGSDSTSVKEHWKAALSRQESIIEAVAPLWNADT